MAHERRKLPRPHRRAPLVVGPAGQRGHRAIDLHPGMVVPRGDLRALLEQAPRGGQRRMATDRRFVHKQQLPLLRPVRPYLLQLRPEGDLRLGPGLPVAVTPPAQAQAPPVQHLP